MQPMQISLETYSRNFLSSAFAQLIHTPESLRGHAKDNATYHLRQTKKKIYPSALAQLLYTPEYLLGHAKIMQSTEDLSDTHLELRPSAT